MTVSASDLQLQLVRQLAQAISDGTMKKGEHLRETELCRMFEVSRSPVRAALSRLEEVGLVKKEANRGFFVADASDRGKVFLASLPKTDDEQIKEAIAKDWFDGQIDQEVSEGEVRRRYGLGRLTTQRILNALADDGIVSRMPGYGWQFEQTLNSMQTHDESYDFRLVIEPSGILSATFQYDATAGANLRKSHKEIIVGRETEWTAAQLFSLDADFHEFVAKCAQNRYILHAVRQQNRLRRLLEYNSLLNTGRLKASCLEHLSILDALEKGDCAAAAGAMMRHLQAAKDAGPNFRNKSSVRGSV